MAVYTEVSVPEARSLLYQLKLGELISLKGCQGGIENTNFFVTTERNGQLYEYVLTLFERLTFGQLPFYLRLMKHLAQRGILVPEPHANALGDLVLEVKGKPAAVVNRLRGKNELVPTPMHCVQVGAMLAKMHLAGQDFDLSQPHLRGLDWWNQTVPVVMQYLTESQKTLIQQELIFQNQIVLSANYAALPRGPIHADLFRDNVMFDRVGQQPELTGFFDFYFAGIDSWLFDLAVCLNDWCIDLEKGMHDPRRASIFIASYHAVRPLQTSERELLPAMLRAGALRFWISRLWDFYLPRKASLLKAHDPGHFERILCQRVANNLHFDHLMASA